MAPQLNPSAAATALMRLRLVRLAAARRSA